MTLPINSTGPVGCGPDFKLPWNTTRTMADVWADKPDVAPPEPKQARARSEPESHTAKAGFAGKGDELFVLRDWQGAYLHSSCEGMTQNAQFAWKGTEHQLRRVREKYPNTADLLASAAA
jgi:hypothetical protein